MLDAPNMNGNDRNMQQIRSYLTELSDQINYQLQNVLDRLEDLESRVSKIEGEK